eukprot:957678_1
MALSMGSSSSLEKEESSEFPIDFAFTAGTAISIFTCDIFWCLYSCFATDCATQENPSTEFCNQMKQVHPGPCDNCDGIELDEIVVYPDLANEMRDHNDSNRTNLLLMVICGLLALLVVFQVIKCMWWAYNHYCKQSKSSISMEKICDFDSDLEIQQEAKKIRIMNWIIVFDNLYVTFDFCNYFMFAQ